uniref:Uncharacterized protein n=1 Tax=mine drainage metagenome TaxID=410659 RepID=E6QWK4_9ZZZZ
MKAQHKVDQSSGAIMDAWFIQPLFGVFRGKLSYFQIMSPTFFEIGLPTLLKLLKLQKVLRSC